MSGYGDGEAAWVAQNRTSGKLGGDSKSVGKRMVELNWALGNLSNWVEQERKTVAGWQSGEMLRN